MFYSVGIFIIFYIFKRDYIGPGAYQNFFPITYNIMWFASAYFVLYSLAPFINKLINYLSKKQHLNLIILLLILFSIIPTLSTSNMQCNDLIWFIVLYLISGYISKYKWNYFNNIKKNIFIIIGIISLLILSTVIFLYFNVNLDFHLYTEKHLFNMNSILMVLLSIVMFKTFILIKPFHNKIINLIASTTFGIYLIHDNHLVRRYIWLELFNVKKYQDDNTLILYSIGIVLLVFLVCFLIEFIRQNLIERLYVK